MAQGSDAPGVTQMEPSPTRTEPTPHQVRRADRPTRITWLVLATIAAALAVVTALTVLRDSQVDQPVPASPGVAQPGTYGSHGEIPSTFVQQDAGHNYGSLGEIPSTFAPGTALGRGEYGSRGEIPSTFGPPSGG